MKLLVLAVLISAVSADNYCNGVNFKDQYYTIEFIKEGVNHVHQIALNRNDNTLYFTYDQLAKVPSTALGYINLDNRKVGFTEAITNATAVAIDQVRNKVYIGGSQGLYSINDKMVPEKLPVDDNIQHLFFKDVLYYTNKGRQAFKFDNGAVTPLPELQGVEVDKLIADDDNNLFFLQNKKLFRVKIGTRIINTHERFSVDVLTTDVHFKTYIVASDGVYTYNKYKYVLDKVSTITDLKELTFNKKDEPVYVIKDIIAKLNLSPIPCFGD